MIGDFGQKWMDQDPLFSELRDPEHKSTKEKREEGKKKQKRIL